VHIEFASAEMAAVLSPALAHLRGAAGQADLTIRAFDSVSTGTPPPRADWRTADIEAAGVVRTLCDNRHHTVFQVAIGLLTMLDRAESSAICWVRDGASLPMPERAAPFRRLFQEWFRGHGSLVVHAAAVGHPDGGVLIAGQEGAGKSTTALACLCSSLRYASDDYCLVELGPSAKVHSLYCSGKSLPHDLARLPFLEAMIANPHRSEGEKLLYLLHDHVPDRLIEGFPLRAVLVPQVTDEERSSVGPVSPAGALQALAATTVLLSPQRAAPTLGALADLLRRVPYFQLRLSRDTDSTTEAIEGVLAGGAP
jgi:hypothetical protein